MHDEHFHNHHGEEHHEHIHQSHEHGHDLPAETPNEMIAVLTYMLQHNIHHGEELAKMAQTLEDKGMNEAANTLLESVHYFEHGNEKLSETLELVKNS